MMKRIILTIILCGLTFCFFSCQEEEKKSEPTDPQRITLVYAVNNSSLAYDYEDNEKKMLSGLSGIDTDRFLFYVYKREGNTPMLCRVVHGKEGVVGMQTVKRYPDQTMSSDPERLAEVIRDVTSSYPGLPATLFMWGHGTGWFPEFSSHRQNSGSATLDSPSFQEGAVNYSFGGEGSNSTNKGDWMDLLEMADAIPTGRFETIWFDACYMSGIEVAYELRDKCRYLVAYPTEIYSDGLPYDKVLPKIMNAHPDLVSAASILYDYYNDDSLAVTVAVMDLNAIEPLASACREMITGGRTRPDFRSMKNYSRSSRYPLYDFGQLQKGYSAVNGVTEKDAAFDQAMGDFILYKACSSRDFNSYPIDKQNYSGLNAHPFTDNGTAVDEYYKQTSWYRAVYNN